MEEIENDAAGVDRRTLLKRGAVVGGALVWATPVVQSLASPAFAAGSAPCTARVIVVFPGQPGCFDIGSATVAPACCSCLQAQAAASCGGPCSEPSTFTASTPVAVACPV